MGKRRVSIQQKGEITVNAFNFNLKKAKEAGLNVASYPGFSVEWARFFHHNYDIVIGPVADAILDQEIYRFKREFPKTYLEDGPLQIFIDRVNQFGSSYTQYCFCTDKALNELKKI